MTKVSDAKEIKVCLIKKGEKCKAVVRDMGGREQEGGVDKKIIWYLGMGEACRYDWEEAG